MSDDDIIRHCAPTLAGLKTGSIFACPYKSREAELQTLRQTNRRLRGKGLRIIPLRFSQQKMLVYLYRPQYLSADLKDAAASRLLAQCGYCTDNCEQCLSELVRKLRKQEAFPHEIGLFLGYPPEDVWGFMEQGPDRCKCSGCWKVYGDPEAARKKFAQYKKCTRVYWDQWSKGKDIERLTVAG